MNILVIGTGYVGLVSGACFSEFGYKVTCLDQDNIKIKNLKKGIIPIYEPGLNELVKKNITNRNLNFDTNLNKYLNKSDCVFLAVGTPSRRGDGHADLKFVFKAVEEICLKITKKIVLVTKSTVPVGTAKKIENVIKKLNKQNLITVASNPEFLREGSAINDFLRPDRVVIGTNDTYSKELLNKLYSPLNILQVPIVNTDTETSELIKYASNSFLATKITFINEIASFCKKTGANINDVSKAMGLDKRIGSKFLHSGPGYGGSCFPKDTLAMSRIFKDKKIKFSIVDTVIKTNNKIKEDLSKEILKIIKANKINKILFLGLSFKPETDDIRESSSIFIINYLLKKNKNLIISAHDPVAIPNCKKEKLKIHYHKDLKKSYKKQEMIIIATEWNIYRSINFDDLYKEMSSHLIYDLRNIYSGNKEILKLGFKYHSISSK
jgi:UDPglucose 6-dehydrogenase